MNQFDFLQKATIGQYIPADSLLHRIDPRAKIIGFGLLILAVTFSSSGIGVLIGLLAAWIGLLTARIPIQGCAERVNPAVTFFGLDCTDSNLSIAKRGGTNPVCCRTNFHFCSQCSEQSADDAAFLRFDPAA